MKEMESQASFYWERDNTTHFILRGKDMIFYVKGTWEGYEWDDEEKLIPDKVNYPHLKVGACNCVSFGFTETHTLQ